MSYSKKFTNDISKTNKHFIHGGAYRSIKQPTWIIRIRKAWVLSKYLSVLDFKTRKFEEKLLI